MKLKKINIFLSAILIFLSVNRFALGSSKGFNEPRVVSSESGRVYARCIPHENEGTKGLTQIYRVGKDKDELIAGYDWYDISRICRGRFVPIEKIKIRGGLSSNKAIDWPLRLDDEYVNAEYRIFNASENQARIVSSFTGRTYARCIPAGEHGNQGTTKIYKVEKEQDKLIYSYDWYNPGGILLSEEDAKRYAVIRLREVGKYKEGLNKSQQPEFSIYINGKVLKTYTTQELINLGAKDSPVRNRKGNQGAEYKIIGYEHAGSPGSPNFFVIEIQGRKIRFDLYDGEIWSVPLSTRCIYPYSPDGKKNGEYKWFGEDNELIASGIYKDDQPLVGTFYNQGDGVIKAYKEGKRIESDAGIQKLAAPVVFLQLTPYEEGVLMDELCAGKITDLKIAYQAITHSNAGLRREAATYLGDYGDSGSIPYLIDALSDDALTLWDYSEPGMIAIR